MGYTNRDLLAYVFSQPTPRKPFWGEIAEAMHTTTEHVEKVCHRLSGPDGLLTWGTLGEQPKTPQYVNIQPRGHLTTLQQLLDAAVREGVNLDEPLTPRA